MQPPDAAALPDTTVEVLAAITFAAILALAIALIAGGLMRRLLASVEGRTQLSASMQKAPVRLVRLITFVIAMIGLVFPALALVGVDLPVALEGEQLGQWAASTALRIGVIVLLAITANRVVNSIVGRAELELSGSGSPSDVERRKRAQTIARTLNRFLTTLITVAALLMVLRALDVDITPLLTGAGILGLAVGFGAQTLVKDVISGFFLILEDQVRVGDAAIVNGTAGVVEQINMRTIVLRDMEGTVHVIPNGQITTLANRSKDFSCYVLDIGIDYDDDVDRAIEVVQRGGRGVAAGSRVHAAHPRTARSARRGRLRRLIRHPALPNQDRPAQPVERRPRTASPRQESLRSRGPPHTRPAGRSDDAEITSRLRLPQIATPLTNPRHFSTV